MICSDVPDVASECEAGEEKQLLLSTPITTNTNNLTLTFPIQKKFGVGVASVMSDENRNEFEFHTTTGFEIESSISILSKNFKENLGVKNGTYFDWSTSPDNMWQMEQSTTVEIKTKSGCATEVYEVVGRCAFVDVRLTEFVRVDICDGIRNETTVPISNDIVNLTFRRNILKPVDNKIQKYKPGVLKNNAFVVVTKPDPLSFAVEKFLKKFKI